VNFIHPRVVNALAASKLTHCCALYSMIVANARWQASGTCGLEQRELAARLRRTKKTIRRQEQALVRSGLLEVIHRGRCNRRQLRPVTLDALPVVSRERGHGCPHSGDTDVPTLRAASISSLPSKNPLQRRAESDRAARGGREASPRAEKSAVPGLMPDQRRRLYQALAEFVEECRIFKHAWPEVHQLAAMHVRREGLPRTLDHLRWVAKQTRGADREARGGRTLSLLRSREGAKEDKRSGRTGMGVRVGGD
jgi:hypothetical protein